MTLALAIGISISFQAMDYDQAWKSEQAARLAAEAEISAAPRSHERTLKGVRDLEALLAFTRRPEIERLTDPDGLQAFVMQRSEIEVDLAQGYARLKDRTAFLRALRELRENLAAGNPATVAASGEAATDYATMIATDEDVRALLSRDELDRELAAIRRKSPDYHLATYPYDLSDTPRISETDRVAGLSQLWSEAKYNFANFDLVPTLDWNGAYAAFLPRVRSAKDRYEYYNVLREFMALLHDGHTDVQLPLSLRKREIGVGLSTALVENRVVVVALAPALAKLGISRGDVVEEIDGIPAVDYGRERWANRVSASTTQGRNVTVYTYLLWRGPEGSTVRVGLRKPDGRRSDLVLRRGTTNLLPPVPPYEFKILPAGAAYFAFNTCESDVPADAFVRNLDAIRGAGRLIIDVRANGGGNSTVGYRVLACLLDHPSLTSKWETPQYQAVARAWRRPQERYSGPAESIQPDPQHFGGPVVVLTGPRTFSAAEDFASACKTSRRVTLVDEATGGSTGQPLLIRLPGGGGARICTKRDRYPDGSDFVGKGVTPDVEVHPTVAAMQQGRDLALERAVRFLSGER